MNRDSQDLNSKYQSRDRTSSLDVVIPALFGPMPGLDQTDLSPSFPTLDKVLARATVSSVVAHGLDSTLLSLFGLTLTEGKELPLAPYCRLADEQCKDQAFYFIAAPVHLRPDQDRVLLFDSADLQFSQSEAEQLAALLQDHFREEGWKLSVPTPSRWYLGLQQTPELGTHGLDEVVGRNMDLFLPFGAEAAHWHGTLNEIQMLFHGAELNQQRAEQGVPPINGLWLYGGGRFQVLESGPYGRVWSDLPLAKGLAAAADIQVDAVGARQAGTFQGSELLVMDELHKPVRDTDPHGWCQQLEQVAERIEGLVEEVRCGSLKALNLYPCNGELYRITRAGLRRFWRRGRGFSERVQQDSR
jgi:hypothetical protein